MKKYPAEVITELLNDIDRVEVDEKTGEVNIFWKHNPLEPCGAQEYLRGSFTKNFIRLVQAHVADS